MLVCHLEEQQIRQPLDVVAIAHPACLCVARRQVVAEDVAVVPKLLNDLQRMDAHSYVGLLSVEALQTKRIPSPR